MPSFQHPAQYPDQRVAVFVDVANMYHSARNLHNAKVDFGRVLQVVVAGRKLIRARAYVVRSDSDQEQDFFTALEKQGYEIQEKELQIFFDGAKKGDWDVGISVDAMKIANKVDVVVLITGDGDFIPLVEFLQETKGCRVEVAAFGKTTSSKLIEAADAYLDLDREHRRYLIPVRAHPRRGVHSTVHVPDESSVPVDISSQHG